MPHLTLRGLDNHLQPPEHPVGDYQPGDPCDGYFTGRAQSPTLDLDLATLAAYLTPLADGGVIVPATMLRARRLLASITAEQATMPTVEDVECGYTGVVEAVWEGDRRGNGTFYWTCPRCESDRSEDREAGDTE